MTLSKRARAILYSVVSEFIATGEPVGSRTLVKKYGFSVSAATIRNVLADLEDAGFLTQPHTSAGRVPTGAAFRLFIDALMQVRQLSPEEHAKIRDWFDDARPGEDLLRRTGQLLTDLTGSAAIVVRPRLETRTVLKARFIPTRPGELLSVLVLSDGSVENRFIAVEEPLSSSELERLHNMLEAAVEGRTLSDLRNHFAAALEASRDELVELRRLGLGLVNAAIDGSARSLDVVIEGQARLLERTDFASTEHLRELVQALEEREKLVLLLDRTLASDRVQVYLGEETSEAVGFPVSLVARRYGNETGPGGAVGVLGPQRMDYASVVPIVGATARAMEVALERTRDGDKHVEREASPSDSEADPEQD